MTAQVTDACLQLGVAFHLGPPDLQPLQLGSRASGPALPVRHVGSVDVLLEAIMHATPGDVLVVDNDGRPDEGCLGDLVAMEAVAAGIAGIAIWGRHRDSVALRALDFPIFSCGACPAGPRRLDPRPHTARDRIAFGDGTVVRGDAVFLDDDGMVVVTERVAEVCAVAKEIALQEQKQADALSFGYPLRDQLRLMDYLSQRQAQPDLTFRAHLRRLGAAIER